MSWEGPSLWTIPFNPQIYNKYCKNTHAPLLIPHLTCAACQRQRMTEDKKYGVQRYEKESASPSSPSQTLLSSVVPQTNFKIFKFHCGCEGKSLWPKLVGVQGIVAVTTIKRENPLVNPIIVKAGTFVILNFVCNRVRV